MVLLLITSAIKRTGLTRLSVMIVDAVYRLLKQRVTSTQAQSSAILVEGKTKHVRSKKTKNTLLLITP